MRSDPGALPSCAGVCGLHELTGGGPQDLTHIFAIYAFRVGILSGDVPLGAAVSLFMLPILAVTSFFILRGISQRAKEEAM
jgi:multiple sugar transport system permease protein